MSSLVDRTRCCSQAPRVRLLKLATLLCILAGEAYRIVRFLGV